MAILPLQGDLKSSSGLVEAALIIGVQLVNMPFNRLVFVPARVFIWKHHMGKVVFHPQVKRQALQFRRAQSCSKSRQIKAMV
jgi:hypothetical protein